MSLVLSDNRKSFAPPPEGLLHVVCVDVVDLHIVEGPFGAARKVQIVWQTADTDEEGRRYLICRTYTASLHEKSKLRPMLEAWRGKKFTAEELKGFDIDKLAAAGVNGQVQVVHKLRGDGTMGYDVQAVVPAPKGVPMLKPVDYTRKKDRTDKPAGAGQDDDTDAVPF